MVRVKQMALLHFKEDYSGRINMQTGYRLMMLCTPEGTKQDVYGFIVFRLDETVVTVIQIAVADEHRGKGIGRQAVDWIIQYAENARCDSVVLGSHLESVEFYEESGFERATETSGKEFPLGTLPMEYRRGTRKAGVRAKRRQLSREELLAKVWFILDADCDGYLGKSELRRFAGWSGFGGNDEQWEDEFVRICGHHKISTTTGPDKAVFTKLINDRSENGMFLDNDGLRDMLTHLQIQSPAYLRRRQQEGGGGQPAMVQIPRKEMVQAIFKLCDLDKNGLLNEQEMMQFAIQTGLGETDEAGWKDEFSLLCMDNGADPAQGISVQLLEKMVSDQGESGCYCTDDELRSIKAGLEIEARQRAMLAAVNNPERAALVREAFTAMDQDRDGRLSEQEMWTLASELGFKGDAAQWAEEYKQMCIGGAIAPDLSRLERLVNDVTDAGWYCTDDDLRKLIAEPRRTPPTPAMPGSSPAAPPPAAASSGLSNVETVTKTGAVAKTTSSGAVAKSAKKAAAVAVPPPVKAQAPNPNPVSVSESRAELVNAVFTALRRSTGAGNDSAGPIGVKEMKRFAVFTGFDGSDQEWAEEFKLICQEAGSSTNSLTLYQFQKLVDDEGDGGSFCANDELKNCLRELETEGGVADG